MSKNKLRTLYTAIATRVADEHYPKGDKRRGEFIRDVAVLYSRMEGPLRQMLIEELSVGGKIINNKIERKARDL